MADDVTLPGTGAVVATDDIGSGRQVQLVKPVYGADGSATMVSSTSPLPVDAQNLVLTGSASSVTTFIGPVDCTGYANFRLALTGTFSGALLFEFSNDGGATWSNPQMIYTSSMSSMVNSISFGVGGPAVGNIYFGPVPGAQVRLRCWSYTSGTVTGTLTLFRSTNGIQNVYLLGTANNLGVVAAFNAYTVDDVQGNQVWTYTGGKNMKYIGGASTQWARDRMPNIFKSVTTSASGNTAVWTPTASRRFQLLRFQVFVTNDAAWTTGGPVTVKFQDATTDTGISMPVYIPSTSGTGLGGWSSGWIDIGGYGYRSAATNQVLNVNLSQALTSGSVGVIACGTEE